MIKMFRVAGLAAAAALLCSTPAAAADVVPVIVAPVSPALHAVAATPVTIDASTPTIATVTPAPVANAYRAIFQFLPEAAAAHSNADTALTPGRARPDHFTVAPGQSFTVNSGVVAQSQTRRPLADLVAENLGAQSTDDQFECLASAVYFESRGEPLEGQLAVAEVIINRVHSGRFRESICGVVTQPSQFSFVRGGQIPSAPRASAAWQRSLAIAHIAMNRLAEATGANSLFFHATYVRPNWGRPRIARIGNHIFYR